jgi:hypothetical protein
MRNHWTSEDIDKLVELYPTTKSEDLCRIFNFPLHRIYNKAHQLGIKKTDEYLSVNGGRLKEGNQKSQFKKGQPAWNKGMKGLVIGGVQTQFKKGHTPPNVKPIGFRSLRDGYLVEKTATGFEFVHKLIWKQHHGEIPQGLFIVFKDKNKQNICIENLEAIDRVEHIRRNHIQNLPKELREVINIKKQITRKINSYGKKQNDRPTRSPF